MRSAGYAVGSTAGPLFGGKNDRGVKEIAERRREGGRETEESQEEREKKKIWIYMVVV